ncbi:MAG TPA: putative nucleotidyltransferase substrate binding domain-containing protein [Gemmataceae bacterium]|nr:putative nucleotidyltransferase substrate binding domain-containing protein [Gemmataceae bacterium]
MAPTDDRRPAIRQALRALLGDAPGAAERSLREECINLAQSVRQPADVALHVEPYGGGRWSVAVCTADSLGALSLVAGLFTAFRLDVVHAQIRTLHLPPPSEGGRPRRGLLRRPPAAPRPPTHLLFDVFEVRALGGAETDVWPRFREELAALARLPADGQGEQARDAVADRVSGVLRPVGAAAPLPVKVAVDNEPGAACTRLTVRSADTPGFLFAFSNALAGFTINIERAEVRTVRGEAVDAFWVTDVSGRPIRDEERIHELRVATALVKQFTHLLPHSPDPGQALRQFHLFVRELLTRPRWTDALADLESPDVLETLAQMMGVSRFLWEDFLRVQHENLFPVVLDAPGLGEPTPPTELREDLMRRLAGLAGWDDRVRELNAFKDRALFRIDLRRITGRSTDAQFAAELTDLAELVTVVAADLVHESLAPQFGRPQLADGRECRWAIVALGKFGGRELGFASDLELIVVYEGPGNTTGPQSITNAIYFDRFVQTFQDVVVARQAGVFEIDLRLRPHGRAGSLASSQQGFDEYYTEGGGAIQFERMALVKLRAVAGDRDLGARLEQIRDRFTYSGRPFDPDDVRHMRRRQATELVPFGAVNAKYSAGGLVDVEYYVQAQQILAGCADAAVRTTNTLDALERLAERGVLPAEQCARLAECYRFFRRLISALRVVHGRARDLLIPPNDSPEFAHLAHRMQCADPEELRTAIAVWRDVARRLWA